MALLIGRNGGYCLPGQEAEGADGKKICCTDYLLQFDFPTVMSSYYTALWFHYLNYSFYLEILQLDRH